MHTTCAACKAVILLCCRSVSGSLVALEESPEGTYLVIDGKAYPPQAIAPELEPILGKPRKYAEHLSTCKGVSK